ncbi:heme NO-binding domain-containing protein [Roseibacillus persicicus]|uniref:Guanylate cyclase n=1 Tax=Roseibacillus persicicus TaxID=454148 RepID=A0A918TR95_9BACT|nr:heme NO-binding domain-containing protein [Roseibacillus persicicus]MDQ8189570.1 heme NO-binding domain-containing protein [Roseibacillus persicicus]GHC59670.1 guanylate cyclase [Roseibacillus persicicus]
MKGIIFTEFLSLVEDQWDEDMVDDIIDACELPSGGAYTSVGTYNHTEIVNLVIALSEKSGVPVPQLLNIYGKHLFGRLAHHYPHFIDQSLSLLEFLEGVERYIHVEVKKLYPDAELPSFETKRLGPNKLEMIYRSSRHLDDVCHGLMEGSMEYFKAKGTITREPLEDGTKFIIDLTE